VNWIKEVSEISIEDKVEEAAERSKDDNKLNDKSSETNKTKLESRSNLTKCFLETECL
jgi:hypothetical protein